MKSTARTAFLIAGIAVIATLGGAATAQEGKKDARDAVAAWTKAPNSALKKSRAGYAFAHSSADYATQTIDADGPVNAGNVNLASHAIGGKMSITAINTGNNVVMTNSLAINVYLSAPAN